MAEKKRDVLEPAFDGGLLNAKYLIGGMFVRKTRAQRNQIGQLFRFLDGTYSTMCFVSSENIFYELINNPASPTTSDSDWRIAITIQSGLKPLGTWDASNADPEIFDVDAVDLEGNFYIVTGAASPVLVTIPGLFGGAATTVKNGDLVVSNGSVWFLSQLSITWDTLNKPQVIIDYVNGIVIDHSHAISDVVGLEAALDEKYDENDVASLVLDFDSIADTALIQLGFLKQYYYTKSDVYTKTEIDGLIPDLSDFYTKSQTDDLLDQVYDDVIASITADFYDKDAVDILISDALNNVPGLIIGEVTLSERDALVGGVSVINTYTLKNRHRVVTTDPDTRKWVDEFIGLNGNSGSIYWNRLYEQSSGGGVSVPGTSIDCGLWNPTGGILPETGGTGPAGVVSWGNFFEIAGIVTNPPVVIIGTLELVNGSIIRAREDEPEQDDTKWKGTNG